jgi:hypothetical protein
MGTPKGTDSGRHKAWAAGNVADGFICWLVIPVLSGLLLDPAFHYKGGDFVVVWAVAVALAISQADSS